MVWKQDLAKLKQQLENVGEPKPKPPIPKPIPKPEPVGTIEDEDTLFLNAMGRRQAAATPRMDNLRSPSEVPPPLASAPPAEEDFQAAMGGLKGLKSLGPKIPAKVRADQPAAAPVSPVELPPSVTVPEVSPPEVVPSASNCEAPIRTGPALIHLAAGMALEVDGSLDLRGHTAADALERFRERLQDGIFLGWRTFHVTLDASEEVRESFLAFLCDPEARIIARYAQAPIPMGGSQAWILYYENPTAH